MGVKVISHEKKKARPVVDLDWMRYEAIAESTEVPVLGTVAAGRPIEAIPSRQTISIP